MTHKNNNSPTNHISSIFFDVCAFAEDWLAEKGEFMTYLCITNTLTTLKLNINI